LSQPAKIQTAPQGNDRPVRFRLNLDVVHPPEGGGGPEGAAEAWQLRRSYLEALKCLPAEWRSVVELRAGLELSYREIAEAIGKSEAAVESILFRARERLARDLAPYRSESEP